MEPGLALRQAAEESIELLAALAAHEAALGAEAAAAIRETVAAVRDRLAKEELVVAVVGEKKAGKSTFLNAVLGARLLGAAVRECTGTVTTIRHGPRLDYVARFEDGRVERFAEQAPDTAQVDLAALAAQRLALDQAVAALPEALRVPAPEGRWARLRWTLRALGHRGALTARDTAARRLDELEALGTARRLEVFERFAAAVRRLTDMAEAGPEVASLELWVPSAVLPPGLAILDTPGANTDDERNQARAWQAIEAGADGCLLLSDLQQVMSRSTREFLQAVRAVVPHVILVLTKQDRALANAEGAEAQLDEARRLGLKRFAREMGRAPDEVLALSVAAEPAIADGPDSSAGLAFEAEVARLFEVIRLERALMVSARATTAIALCLRRIEEARARAESTYAERIAAMEAQRIEEPDAFKAQELAALRLRVREELAEAAASSAQAFRLGWARLRARWTMQVLAATDREDLRARLEAVTQAWPAELEGLLQDLPMRERMLEMAMRHSRAAHRALGDRYRLAGGQAVAALPEIALEIAEDDEGLGLKAGLTEAWLTFNTDLLKLGVGGAAAGAAIGSLVAPGLGTLVGGLIGSLASRILTIEMLQRDCLEALGQEMAAVETRVEARLTDVNAHAETVLRLVETQMELAIRQFQAAIEALITQEAARLAAERERLADLVGLRERLETSRSVLRQRTDEARRSSRGLCGV